MTYLLDTDTCIDILRGRRPELRRRFSSLTPGTVAISAITFGELNHGIRKSASRNEAEARLHAFVALVPVLDVDAAAGEHYGTIRTELESRGRVIGNNDLWIAAHARSLGLVLVTSNRREFDRVPGLRTESWRTGK